MGSNELRLAREDARRLRWELGYAPDGPVDPFEALAAMGVEAVYLPLGEGNAVEGVSVSVSDHGFVLINSSKKERRARFTCAHEIGHLRLHDREDVLVDTDYDIYGDDASVDPDERAANVFAAEFLMPADAVRQLVADISDSEAAAGAMVHEFGTSPMTAAVRLAELDLFSTSEVQDLRRTINDDWRRFWREQRLPKDEGLHDRLELPDSYRRRAEELLQASIISDERYEDVLALPPSLSNV